MSLIEMSLWLLFFHLVGDYTLQSAFLFDAKKKHLWALFVHCFLWSGTIALGLCIVYEYRLTSPQWGYLISSHLLMDYHDHPWCSRNVVGKVFDFDTFYHIASLGILVLWITSM